MNAQQTLFSLFDTAYRFFSETGEAAAPLPDFPESPLEENITESRAEALERIASAVLECRKCPLAQGRTNAVPGEGAKNAIVMVIGEGPGADEDRLGRPFVGKSGQLLDKMLISISLSREKNAYIANIVKCRPPGNRDPLPEEASACLPFLREQIEAVRPKAILAVGRIAAKTLLNTEEGINRLRGRFFDYCGIPLMATYHPSALLRNESLKRPAWEDLKAFRERIRLLAPNYEEEFANGISER